MPARISSDDPSEFPTRARRRLLLCGAGLLLICVVASLPMGMTGLKVESLPGSFLTVPVERGSLEITLSQRGLLDSAKNVVVSSECEWPIRIIGLIPEGTWVEAGEIVVELDSSEMTEKLKEREILLINAEADLIQATEVLAMQELENESARAKAQLVLQLARLDLRKYAEGEFPKTEKEAKAAAALAKEDLSRSQERLDFVMRMARKGYESPMSVERERIELLKYDNRVVNAEFVLKVLTEHTRERTMAELEAAASEAESNLDRVEQIATIAVLNRQVQVHTRQTKYNASLEYVERLRTNIAACTIRAPVTGDIIYANEGSIRNEIIEGEYVRMRQEVVRIPDLSKMDVELRIHESLIDGVRKGLPATIRLDAYPSLHLVGHVEAVSRVPTSGRNYNYDLKEYEATVRIDTGDALLSELKPGLTAQVEILVDRHEDCLRVPAQSVVTVAGRPVVFVKTTEGIEHREIEVGINNDVSVQVLTGLSEQDRVLLSPRTTCSEELIVLQERFAGSETDVANIGG